MTSFIMYDVLKPSVFRKIWRRGPLTSFLGGRGSDKGVGRKFSRGANGKKTEKYQKGPIALLSLYLLYFYHV